MIKGGGIVYVHGFAYPSEEGDRVYVIEKGKRWMLVLKGWKLKHVTSETLLDVDNKTVYCPVYKGVKPREREWKERAKATVCGFEDVIKGLRMLGVVLCELEIDEDNRKIVLRAEQEQVEKRE